MLFVFHIYLFSGFIFYYLMYVAIIYILCYYIYFIRWNWYIDTHHHHL